MPESDLRPMSRFSINFRFARYAGFEIDSGKLTCRYRSGSLPKSPFLDSLRIANNLRTWLGSVITGRLSFAIGPFSTAEYVRQNRSNWWIQWEEFTFSKLNLLSIFSYGLPSTSTYG
jgi:hypothetical protein